jgi:ABC-type sugar transport system ATPase subunit
VRAAAERDQLTEIVLGIRPEQMHLTDVGRSDPAPPASGSAGGGPVSVSAGRDPGSAVLVGDVVLVEELGADALLHVRLADDGGAVVARAEGRKPPAPGQRVAFAVQSADVLAFNPANGARLAG